MTALQGILLLLILTALLSIFYYIHEKRKQDKYIQSYRWFVKILR